MNQQQTPQEQPAQPTAPSPPRRWVGPAVFAAMVVVPALILIFSNTENREVSFAWWEWNAPLWVILGVTFVAGAIGTRLFMWLWRTYRKRTKKAAGPEGSVQKSDGK